MCGHKTHGSVRPLSGVREGELRTTVQGTDLHNRLNEPHMPVILVISLLGSHNTQSAL